MAKTKVQYVCNSCGAFSSTWAGRCYQCNEWNTLVEQIEVDTANTSSGGTILRAEQVKRLAAKDTEKRISTGMEEVDSVLGGGFVAGSVNLIAGQPGIG
ncbi:MAG TPA: DNA repair protein RadA, partial [Candidatus Saccharimonadales bacterium]|nr:DNA repair protein RadA [Candidatus Saccharimonadales bacterium]